jgi:predicted metal-dependent phosphoesterase TrpH
MKKTMFDLHIHSNCSDGSDSPDEILRKAELLGLYAISITDHDNCNAYNDLDTTIFSGKIITGIEMQAYFKGLSIELLGYGFDVKKMRELSRGLYLPFKTVNQEELHRLYERCVSLGMQFAPNVIENYDSGKCFYATEYLHDEMRKRMENKPLVPDEASWEHENIFFKRHTSNPNSPFYIDESDIIPAAKRVVDIIHKAGGKAFIPHVFQYEENAAIILNGLVDEYEIDGIECFYPSFTQEQTDYLLDFCSRKELLTSGGSDYHGDKRKTRMGIEEADVKGRICSSPLLSPYR